MTGASATYEFEQLYIRLREKEGRIYSDEELMKLPLINRHHSKYSEWLVRKESFKQLLAYLKNKSFDLNILEVGCGNGWLSGQLAATLKGNITATDINITELEQAKRVFVKKPNLQFIYGDLRDNILAGKNFDIIIFAASIQYFSSFKEIIDVAMKYLKKNGEIHIIDTNFYKEEEIALSKKRTIEYYDTLGFSALSDYYFHHGFAVLEQYDYKILRNSNSWKNKLSLIKNPFPWIVIKNSI